MDKKKKCPNCGWINDDKNFCVDCGTDIRGVTAKEVCWIVLMAVGTGFKVVYGQYATFEELLDKAGPISRLAQNWLILVFLDEVIPGNTLTAIKQNFVSSDYTIRETNTSKYKLLTT